jgi:hypothetical protein
MGEGEGLDEDRWSRPLACKLSLGCQTPSGVFSNTLCHQDLHIVIDMGQSVGEKSADSSWVSSRPLHS